MEARYEIRSKIGQGGLGSVFCGYDTRIKREIAIKRIALHSQEPETREEATRQLMKEAAALAALQHPNIVTIYDVGQDNEGPYVVMELISGQTLDELIERAPLTWDDFRELAMQSMEALIAAHELNFVHSDLKPSNLMLSWLPSGKFQVKVVDFGLATIACSQSREMLAQLDAVYGSIFFMPPEQFEREPLDFRSDLYSIGCVFYQALAGTYPFHGVSGQEVMQAHLQHRVRPLQDLRADIPVWACDWIMWHLNRSPEDRPQSARDALSIFLQNDKIPNPPMSTGKEPANPAPKRPKLIIPGAAPQPEVPAPPAEVSPALEQQAQPTSAPQPLTPPAGSKPSVHTSSHEIPPVVSSPPQTAVQPSTPLLKRATPSASPALQRPATAMSSASAVAAAPPSKPLATRPKQKLSNATKTTIAAILAVLTILTAWLLLDMKRKNRQIAIVNEKKLLAAKPETLEVPMDAEALELLLNSAVHTGELQNRESIYQALYLAKATDGTDVDKRVAEFATSGVMLPDVREILISQVLGRRKNPGVISILMNYAVAPETDPRFAVAALQAVRYMAADEQFPQLLEILQSTQNNEIRIAAEDSIGQVIQRSNRRGALADRLIESLDQSANDGVRHTKLRLLARVGGEKALKIIKDALDQPANQVAAIASLGSWCDANGLPLLIDFIASSTDMALRGRAFDAASKFASENQDLLGPDASRSAWEKLSLLAKTNDEQVTIIRGLYGINESWVVGILESYCNSENDTAADMADRALRAVEEARQLQND